jgi:hypothetical protein
MHLFCGSNSMKSTCLCHGTVTPVEGEGKHVDQDNVNKASSATDHCWCCVGWVTAVAPLWPPVASTVPKQTGVLQNEASVCCCWVRWRHFLLWESVLLPTMVLGCGQHRVFVLKENNLYGIKLWEFFLGWGGGGGTEKQRISNSGFVRPSIRSSVRPAAGETPLFHERSKKDPVILVPSTATTTLCRRLGLLNCWQDCCWLAYPLGCLLARSFFQDRCIVAMPITITTTVTIEVLCSFFRIVDCCDTYTTTTTTTTTTTIQFVHGARYCCMVCSFALFVLSGWLPFSLLVSLTPWSFAAFKRIELFCATCHLLLASGPTYCLSLLFAGSF